MIINLGENIRPEGLLILPEDVEINVDNDFLFHVDLESNNDFFMSINNIFDKDVKTILLSDDKYTGPSKESVNHILEEFSKTCDASFMSSVLSIAEEKNEELIYTLFQYLYLHNKTVFNNSVKYLCRETPINIFSIKMVYKFHKNKDKVKKEDIDTFMKNWLELFLVKNKNTGEEKNYVLKKRLLVTFITNTIKDNFYDISKFSRQIDDFCSQNNELKGIQKMKDAIYNQKKNRMDAKRS